MCIHVAAKEGSGSAGTGVTGQLYDFVWVQETQSYSSVRTASALNCWPMSPAPGVHFKKSVCI